MRTIVFAHLCQLGPGLAALIQGGMARRRMVWKKALRERPIVSPLVADATQIGAHGGILASSAAEKLSL